MRHAFPAWHGGLLLLLAFCISDAIGADADPKPPSVSLEVGGGPAVLEEETSIHHGATVKLKCSGLEPNDDISLSIDEKLIVDPKVTKAKQTSWEMKLPELSVGSHMIRFQAERKGEAPASSSIPVKAEFTLKALLPKPVIQMALPEDPRCIDPRAEQYPAHSVEANGWLQVKIEGSPGFQLRSGDELVPTVRRGDALTPGKPLKLEGAIEVEKGAIYAIPYDLPSSRTCQIQVRIRRDGHDGEDSKPLTLRTKAGAVVASKEAPSANSDFAEVGPQGVNCLSPRQVVRAVLVGAAAEVPTDAKFNVPTDATWRTFMSPAQFTDPLYGRDGDRASAAGIAIHEGMRFALNKKGEYFLEFMIDAPQRTVSLWLQLEISSGDDASTRTLTLRPVELRPQNTDAGLSGTGRVQYVVQFRGASASLVEGLALDKFKVTRDGRARF